MTKRMTHERFASIRSMIRDLEDLVEGEKWGLDAKAYDQWCMRPWAGADTIICRHVPEQSKPHYTYVATPFVAELSWLFDYLKAVCSEFVDHMNKEAFYGRLADAANRYARQRAPEQSNPKDMCFAILRESMRIVDEARKGEFSSNRNETQIKGIWVQLHPGGAERRAGLAVYWYPTEQFVSLENDPFTFRGAAYRIGEPLQVVPSNGQIMCMAVYYEAG